MLAADQRRLDRSPLRAAVRRRADRTPDPDRLPETLQLDRAEILHLHAPEREPVRARADEELSGLGRLLEPCCQRDRLAGGEGGLAVLGDDLAGLDAHARLERELADRVEDREPGANR